MAEPVVFKGLFLALRSWHPVPSLHGNNEVETMGTVTDLIFLGSKITADGHCSHEIKTFSPRKKNYDQPAVAAAAKLLQLCPTLCNPIDSSPPGSSIPGILQASILEGVAISFSNTCMHAKSL